MFKGSGVAIITPFLESGDVDYPTLENLLNYHVANSTDAIVITGTTGEASTLTNKEHLSVIAFAVSVIAGRIPVIAGTGSNDTLHMVYLSQEAEKYGADGVLCVTPYYNKATQEGLYQHFKMVAEAITIPIILYTVPSRTNLNIEVETLVRLSEFKNIVGIKDATGDLDYTRRIHEALPDFCIYSGNDDGVFDVLELGGQGVISVVANICPEKTHRLVHAYLEGSIEESRKLQDTLMPIIDQLFTEPNPIPIKFAMETLELIPNGRLRLPLTRLSERFQETLKEQLYD